MIELILGGVRSGKSRFAEQETITSGKKKFHIVTVLVLGEEMAERIKIHRQSRGNN